MCPHPTNLRSTRTNKQSNSVLASGFRSASQASNSARRAGAWVAGSVRACMTWPSAAKARMSRGAVLGGLGAERAAHQGRVYGGEEHAGV
jgi:hypothetical protein